MYCTGRQADRMAADGRSGRGHKVGRRLGGGCRSAAPAAEPSAEARGVPYAGGRRADVHAGHERDRERAVRDNVLL